MSNRRVQHQRLFTPGFQPVPSSMDVGEIVVNVADGKAWTKDDQGVVKEISSGAAVAAGADFNTRGIVGDHVLTLEDYLHTLVFVSPNPTVLIPSNIPFERGFRCWVVCNQPDPDYVYVKAQDATITLRSSTVAGDTGPMNSTRVQYSAIELRNIAGSVWSVFGDGINRTEHPAPTSYIPNNGVIFSDGKLTGMNIGAQLTTTKEFAFRTYVKMKEIIPDTGGGDPPPLPPSGGTGTFTVFDEINFRDWPRQTMVDLGCIHANDTHWQATGAFRRDLPASDPASDTSKAGDWITPQAGNSYNAGVAAAENPNYGRLYKYSNDVERVWVGISFEHMDKSTYDGGPNPNYIPNQADKLTRTDTDCSDTNQFHKGYVDRRLALHGEQVNVDYRMGIYMGPPARDYTHNVPTNAQYDDLVEQNIRAAQNMYAQFGQGGQIYESHTTMYDFKNDLNVYLDFFNDTLDVMSHINAAAGSEIPFIPYISVFPNRPNFGEPYPPGYFKAILEACYNDSRCYGFTIWTPFSGTGAENNMIKFGGTGNAATWDAQQNQPWWSDFVDFMQTTFTNGGRDVITGP